MIASGAVMSGDALIVALWLHISGQKRVYGHPVRWLLARAVRVGQVARRTGSSTGGASVRPGIRVPRKFCTPARCGRLSRGQSGPVRSRAVITLPGPPGPGVLPGAHGGKALG